MQKMEERMIHELLKINFFSSFQADYDTETRNVMVDVQQYHLSDLYEFTEYTFWVSAFNANGEGILSEEMTTRYKFKTSFLAFLTQFFIL